jgi:hypothetical protein
LTVVGYEEIFQSNAETEEIFQADAENVQKSLQMSVMKNLLALLHLFEEINKKLMRN